MKTKFIAGAIFAGVLVFGVTKFLRSKEGDGDILIGTTLGLTGNIAAESLSMKKGMQLRIDKQNNAGGVAGKKIRLTILDDGYNPDQAEANAKTLIDKGVDIILFPSGSATTKSYLNLVEQKKIAVLGTSSGSSALRSPTPEYFIHFRASYPDMAYALLSYAKKNLGAQRFALVTQSDITAAGIKESVDKAGVKPGDRIEVSHKRNVTDMSRQAAETIKFKPDAILIWTTSTASKELIKAIGAENLLNIPMMGADLLNPKFSAFLESMGLSKNYIDSQAVPNPETSQLPIVKACRSALGGEKIDGLLLEGWICAEILIYLLKQTGGSTDKKEFIKKAEAIKDLDLGGLKLNFDPKDRKLYSTIWLSTGDNWTPVDVSAS